MRTPESLRVAAVLALASAGCQSAVNPDKIAPVLASTVCSSIYDKVLTRSTGCFKAPRAWIVATSAAPDCAGYDVSADASRMQVDTGKLDACLNDIGAATCYDLFGAPGVGLPGACAQIILPQVPFAGTCYLNEECVQGTYCGNLLACPGTCKRYLAQGATCGSAAAPCDPSLVCRYLSSTAAARTCEAYLAPGADCSKDPNACATGYSCVYSAATVPQYQCTVQAAGGPCQGPEACPVPYYLCIGYNNLVTPIVLGTCQVPKGVGSGCTVGAGECPYGAYCAGPAGASGTCTIYPSPPTVAGTCGSVNGERVDCIGGYCNGTACAPYIAPGQTCSTTFSPDPSVQCGRVQNGYYCAGTSPNPGTCASFLCREP